MVSTTLKNSLKTGLIFNGNEAAQYLNSLICTVFYNLLAKYKISPGEYSGFVFN